MEDSTMKIKTVEPITLIKKIKTIEPVTLAKNIISFPIEFVCDNSPINFVSIESAENFFPYNMISDSAYSLALNFFFFFFEIGKENLNNKELKQGHVEPIKEET